MQLDKTKIVIRQRSWLDLVDLSLIVFREYWKPLLAWSMVGAIPMMGLNLIVLAPVLNFEEILLQSPVDVTASVLRVRYAYLATLLVILEAPFALLGTTYFLGQAVFVEKPAWREVVKGIRRPLPLAVLVLCILRLGWLGLVAALFIPRDGDFAPWLELFVMGVLLLGGAAVIRAFRPFAPEILVLEQCPIRIKPGARGMTYQQRSRWLHSALSSELFGRFLMMIGILTLTGGALTLSETTLLGFLFDLWEWGWWIDWILFPINLWILAVWGTIFRFLSYLDSRIRLEGWEIELRFMAEAQRLEAAA